MEEKILKIDNVNLSYKNGEKEKEVLKDISFDIKNGEIVSIIGPSGCGKSTLLGAIGGINNSYEGRIIFNGQKIKGPSSNIEIGRAHV